MVMVSYEEIDSRFPNYYKKDFPKSWKYSRHDEALRNQPKWQNTNVYYFGLNEDLKEAKKSIKELYDRYEEDGVIKGKGSSGKSRELWIKDFESNTWELYEEEDNWDLADNIPNVANAHPKEQIVCVRDVKTFIQKVKEDMKKEAQRNTTDFIHPNRCNEIIDKRSGDL